MPTRPALVLMAAVLAAAGCGSPPPEEQGDVPQAPPGVEAELRKGAPPAGLRASSLSRIRFFRNYQGDQPVSWSPDGRRYAAPCGYPEHRVYVFDLTDQTGGRVRAIAADQVATAWSPGVGVVVAAGGQPHIQAIDADSGKQLWALDESIPGQIAADPTGRRIVLSFGGGGMIVLNGEPDPILIVDAKTGAVLHRVVTTADGLMDVRHSRDGRFLALLENGVTLRDAATGERLWTREVSAGAVDWSPDSRWIVGLAPNRLLLFDARDGRPAGSFVVDSSVKIDDMGRPRQDVKLRCFAVSPVEFVAAIGRTDGCVELWDLATGRRLARWRGDGPGDDHCLIRNLAFSPDGRFLAGQTQFGLAVFEVVRSAPADGVPLPPEGLEAAWTALAAGDPAEGRKGIAWFSRDPEGAVRLLGDRLFPTPAQAGLAPILEGLAAADPETRRAAREEALRHPELAPVFAERAGAAADPEVATALRESVAAMEDGPTLSPELRARDRAVAALEIAGTAEARRVLEQFAETSPVDRERGAARKALERLVLREK